MTGKVCNTYKYTMVKYLQKNSIFKIFAYLRAVSGRTFLVFILDYLPKENTGIKDVLSSNAKFPKTLLNRLK